MEPPPPEENHSLLLHQSKRKRLMKNFASDAQPHPQRAHKRVHLNYKKCSDSVDVEKPPWKDSVPQCCCRHSLSSGADYLLTCLGFLIQKLWKQGLSVAGGRAVFHSDDTMQLTCLCPYACRPPHAVTYKQYIDQCPHVYTHIYKA